MKPVELDYLAPPRSPVWPGVVVLALALVVAAGLVARYRSASDELARLELAGKLVAVERRPLASVPKERLDAEVKAAESVVRELALPWAALIEAVERAASRDVAILQLEPNAETRSVRLVAEARSREAMFQYLRRLGASRGLAEVHVVNHQVEREEPQRPIRFAVQAALGSAR
jgi:Tfp pilus assembly protein PilN